MLQSIFIIFLLYFFVLVFLYFYQRNLLYHPNENNYSGDEISVDIKKVKIRTSDNIELLGWYHEKNLKDFKRLYPDKEKRAQLMEFNILVDSHLMEATEIKVG